MNDSELRDHLETARVAILATIRADGRVDLVPVTFAVEEDLMVTMVDHKPKSTMDLKRLDNIGQFPEVTFLAEHYDDEDWDQLWWVRVRGRAKVHQAGAEWERAARGDQQPWRCEPSSACAARGLFRAWAQALV